MPARIYNHLLKTMPDLPEMLSTQNFKPILKWLREHVHSKGKSMLAEDIISQSCGSGLNPEEFVTYLRDKFIPIYDR